MSSWKHTRPTLPYTFTVGDIEVTCDILQSDQLENVRRIFEVCSKLGGSVSVDEGLADIILSNPNGRQRTALQITETGSGELIGGLMVYPSWLCRSTEAVASAGYIVLTPETQGRGLGTRLILLLTNLSWHSGYLGHVARAAVGGTNTASARFGAQHDMAPSGIIPYSVLTVDGQRLHDAISCFSYDFIDPVEQERRLQDLTSERNKEPEEPDRSREFPPWTFDPLPQKVSPVHSTISGVSFTISEASTSDVPEVETLIRTAAVEGKGFALDEFRDGYFNRKLLRQSHMFVCKTRDGVVRGAALFGRTALCRSASTTIMSVYLVVHPVFDRKLISKSLIKAVESSAVQEGIRGLFVDVFNSDREGMSFLKSSGFNAVGTIEMSGFVKNHGFSPSYLYYKQLRTAKL